MIKVLRPFNLPVARIVALAAVLSACAGPPLTLYTLAPDMDAASVSQAPPGAIMAVSRVSIPDALDSQDILVRDGATLKRSTTSRWAERLSLGITDLVTARLAASNPQVLVTDQPQTGPVTERLAINISRLDVTAAGTVTLVADWTFTPSDPRLPLRLARARLTMNGDTATDAGTVRTIRAAIEALATRIEAAGIAAGISHHVT